jgi:hypothetical protein
MRHFNILLLFAPLSIFATSMGGPLAGYATFRNGSELRAILGTPGSYEFSAPLPLPDGTTRVHPAPGRDFALVERAPSADSQDMPPGIASYDGGAVAAFVPMAGAIASPDWVIFSNEGGAVVLFSAQAGRLQVWSGLPGSPQLILDRTTDGLPSGPTTAAVTEDGKTLLAASKNAVYLVSPNGAPRLLLSGTLIASVAMLRNGQDAVAADRGAGAIQFLHGVASGTDVRVIASGFEDIGAIYPSSDGGSLYAALPTVKSIAAIDLGSGAVTTFDSGAAASQLNRLRNRDTFLISATPRQPGWVFFRDDSEAAGGIGSGKVVFIPALAPGQEEQQ